MVLDKDDVVVTVVVVVVVVIIISIQDYTSSVSSLSPSRAKTKPWSSGTRGMFVPFT